jgi:hypothetical protein
MLRPAAHRRHRELGDWLATMREGEIRRMWMRGKDGTTRVYDIEMASVILTDSAGQPIIDNR